MWSFYAVAGDVLDKWEIATSTENNGEQILPDIAKAIEDKLDREEYRKGCGRRCRHRRTGSGK